MCSCGETWNFVSVAAVSGGIYQIICGICLIVPWKIVGSIYMHRTGDL